MFPFFRFLVFVSFDTYAYNSYWLSNYTSSFVSLVAKKYGDIVVGKLVYFEILLLKRNMSQHIATRW